MLSFVKERVRRQTPPSIHGLLLFCRLILLNQRVQTSCPLQFLPHSGAWRDRWLEARTKPEAVSPPL